MGPGGKLLGLKLAEGGHLTHGHYTENKKISASALYFEAQHYRVDPETGLIDYDALDQQAQEFKPNILIAGASAYPRDFDYKRFREIADKVEGCYLMSDMAHYSGLIASGLMNSPFEYSDVVTTTTHKSLRGPRHAMIFYKKHLEEKINFAVFPGHQGGPHNHTISALATALKQVRWPAHACARTHTAHARARRPRRPSSASTSRRCWRTRRRWPRR